MSEATHIASSTEGWFVMSDTAIIAGPFRSKLVAEVSTDGHFDVHKALGVCSGTLAGYRNMIHDAKLALEQSGTMDDSWQTRSAWTNLDTLVCRIDEISEVMQAYYDGTLRAV